MTKKKIGIVGAGIAGLAAAHFLTKNGHTVKVFEASNRIGGSIHSLKKEGYTLEYGPNTVLLNTKGMRELILSAGLWDKITFSNTEAAKQRFIVKDGKFNAVPTSPISFITNSLLTLSDKLRLLKEPFIAPFKATDNPSIGDFAKKRFGENFYYHFIQPFVTGIYAGDADKIAVKHGMKLLWNAEQNGGSLFKGFMMHMKAAKKEAALFVKPIPKNKMFSFEGGLITLCNHLAKDIDISLNHTPTSAELDDYDKVIFTGKAKSINQYIDQELLKTQLNNVPYSSVSVMHLGFDKGQIPDLPKAFGSLTLADTNHHFLGLLFSSQIFKHVAPDGKVLLTAIIGGARNPGLVEDPKIRQKIMEDLRALLHITGEPSFYEYTVWPDAIPQYHMNHQELLDEVKKFEQANPKFHFASNFVMGVSVGDCVQKVYDLSMKL